MMNDSKTHYEYVIQQKNSHGKWIPMTDVMHSCCASFEIFNLYEERFGNNVRIMRRKITVGDWEVQK